MFVLTFKVCCCARAHVWLCSHFMSWLCLKDPAALTRLFLFVQVVGGVAIVLALWCQFFMNIRGGYNVRTHSNINATRGDKQTKPTNLFVTLLSTAGGLCHQTLHPLHRGLHHHNDHHAGSLCSPQGEQSGPDYSDYIFHSLN